MGLVALTDRAGASLHVMHLTTARPQRTCTCADALWRRPVPRCPGSSLMGRRLSTAITTSAVAA